MINKILEVPPNIILEIERISDNRFIIHTQNNTEEVVSLTVGDTLTITIPIAAKI